LGFKYDDTKTSDARPLTLEDLDVAASNHPVRIEHRGGHTAYVNSVALKMAGVSETTADPPGGRFDRNPATGRLNGRVSENARSVVEKLIPSAHSQDDYREAVKLISRMMSKTGITSVHDAYGAPEDLLGYQDTFQAGDLTVRVYCLIGYRYIDRMINAGVRTGFGNEWVRIGAMKLTCDGSISERTARLSEPYVGRPNDHGILVMTEDDLYTYARKAHEAGWQIGVHANGDVAIDQVLRVCERLSASSSAGSSFSDRALHRRQ
jgi:predicted amidohydrolase YtcJ